VQQTLNLSPEIIVDFTRWVQDIMPYSGRSMSAIFKLTYYRKLYCFGPAASAPQAQRNKSFAPLF
jgi:hypothetical protein